MLNGTSSKKLSFGTFFCLYIARMVLSSFLMTALQVIMGEGQYSFTIIGLLNFVRVPWTIKFLWPPFADRHYVTVRDYKRTIIVIELIYAVALLATGLINVHSEVMPVVILALIFMLTSVMQDIATDVLVILSFKKHDHSMPNNIQSMGTFGGAVIGGGVLFILLKSYGWSVVVPRSALFVCMMVVPSMFDPHIKIENEKPRERAKWADILSFFGRRKIWRQIGFLLLYYVGVVDVLSMMCPHLIDKGYDMKEIGFLTGIIGTAASFVTAWFSGVLICRIGIYKTRIIVTGLIVLTPIYFLAMTFADFNRIAFITGIIYIQACYGLVTMVLYTTATRCVHSGRERTDFIIQIVISHVSGLLVAILAGTVTHVSNYCGPYIAETVVAIFSLICVLSAFKKE